MAIRRRRLIRPAHKLPTKAEKLAAEEAAAQHVDNVINRPADPAPTGQSLTIRPLTDFAASLNDVSRSLQSLGRAMRGAPAQRGRLGNYGFRVQRIDHIHDTVKISALNSDGTIAEFSITAEAYNQLRSTGSLDLGAIIHIDREIETMERNSIGMERLPPVVISDRITVAVEGSETVPAVDLTFSDRR